MHDLVCSFYFSVLSVLLSASKAITVGLSKDISAGPQAESPVQDAPGFTSALLPLSPQA